MHYVLFRICLLAWGGLHGHSLTFNMFSFRWNLAACFFGFAMFLGRSWCAARARNVFAGIGDRNVVRFFRLVRRAETVLIRWVICQMSLDIRVAFESVARPVSVPG